MTKMLSLGGDLEQIPLLTSAWTGEPPHTVMPQDSACLKELRAARVAMRENAVRESDAQLDQALACARETQAPASQRALAAWNVTRNAFMKGVNKVALETTKSIDGLATSLNVNTFNRNFPELARSGTYCIDAFQVKALHGGINITGTLFVTNTHIAYHNGSRISASFALKDIVAVVECTAVDTYDGRPYLIPKVGANVLTNAIQLYLSDHRLAEFSSIAPSNSDLAAEVTNSLVQYSRSAAMCYVSIYEVWAKLHGGDAIVADTGALN